MACARARATLTAATPGEKTSFAGGITPNIVWCHFVLKHGEVEVGVW
jgi:hypothetical protein